MAAAPPLTLDVPDGGIGRATLECSTTSAGELHSIALSVSRAWIDIKIGSTSGADDVGLAAWGVSSIRLQPGDFVLSFTPTGTSFFITAERDAEGFTAITDMDFLEGGDLTLPTPYEEDDLASVRMTQSRDVRWMWHQRHAPRMLVRYANTTWGLAYWLVDDGPFLPVNTGRITLTPGAVSGTDVTLEASADLFTSDHVGGLFQLTHAGQRKDAGVSTDDDWTGSIRVSGVDNNRIFTATVGGTYGANITLQRSVGEEGDWQDVQVIGFGSHQIDDGFDNSIIYYRLGVKSGDYTSGTVDLSLTYASGETIGVGRVVSVVDADSATIDVLAPFGAALATREWSEGAWSGSRGYPTAGDLWDGRLWLGSILDFFASTPDDYGSFSVSGEDDGAIDRQVSVGDASPIRWIKAALRLLSGTDAGAANIDAVRITESQVLQIASTSFDEPVTPTNMTLRDPSAKIAYVDASTNRILRLSYDIETNAFSAIDLNRLNADIGYLGGGFVDLTFQARPLPRVWAPRADGELASVTLADSEEVVGWARLVFGAATLMRAQIEAEDSADDEIDAAVRSSTVTPGVLSGETQADFAHLIVERTLGGRRVMSHERIEMETWRDQADAWFVEDGLKYEGEATQYLTGLDHLLGEDVIVWGDGAQVGDGTFEVVALAEVDPDTFTDGEIGVDLGEGNEVEKAIVGLPMQSRYMSGKLAYGAQAGSAVGEPKKIDHVTVLFYKTAVGGVRCGVVDANEYVDADGLLDEAAAFADANLQSIEDLSTGFTMDNRPPLFTGEIKLGMGHATGSMTDPRVIFTFDGAGPAAILGYVVNMVTNESP